MTVPISKFMRIRITPRNRSLYGFVGELYVLALSHWRVSGVDGRNRLELYFLESALPENSDWISCSGCENSRSSGEKPNFDPKPQKTRNDSSYQFPDTPFPVLPSVVVCHSYFLQSELIERAEKSPLIFPKEKTRGLNALNFNFLLSFLVLLGFWLCVCLQRSGLCPTSPRLHARKVRQKRLPVSSPVHYPTANAVRRSACPP